MAVAPEHILDIPFTPTKRISHKSEALNQPFTTCSVLEDPGQAEDHSA